MSQPLKETQMNRQRIVQMSRALPNMTQYYGNSAFRPAELDDGNKRGFRTVVANDKPTDDFRRVLPEGMPAIASGYEAGQPMMVNHSTYGKDDLPIGRTLTGEYIKDRQIVEADFYLDEEDYNQRILAGIDNGTITDVSMGASGKFTCSYDNSPMGWFGCRKSGHYRGQEIMIDADGNETEKPAEMVSTQYIYAEFTARSVDELSVVYKGAIKGGNITKKYQKYHHDPAQNTEIMKVIRSVYDGKLMPEYELDRLCASYGGVSQILEQTTAPVSVPVAKQIGGKKVSTPETTEYTPEVQAIVDAKDNRINELETQLQTALDRVETLENDNGEAVSQEDLQAGLDRITQLEESESTLQASVDELTAKAGLYDKLVLSLRGKLKLAKRKTGADEDELDNFSTQADEMNDAAAMFALLEELEGKKQKVTAKSFSRIIGVEKEEEQTRNVNAAEQARARAAF